MVITGPILVKRISAHIEYRRDITRYGKDNIYPQKIQELMYRSSYTNGAVEGLAAFTIGQGFEQNGETVVNRHEQDINEIMAIAAVDFSVFGGFALHFNVNELLQITEINNVDFKTLRFGLPDNDGIHRDIKANKNWEGDPFKTLSRTEIIRTFPMWQRREFVDVEEFDEQAGEGFILYYTPVPDQYPRCTFDPVLDSAQTDAGIQMFELSNIDSGFIGANIFKHAGKIQGDEERLKIEQDLRELQGASNSNSIMIVETPPDFEGEIIETIAGNQNADLFNQTNVNVIARIMANFGQPFPIAGIQPPNGGIFNEEQMADSHKQYNSRTRHQRTAIARVFNKFMQMLESGPVDLGEIIELEFELNETEENGEAINNEE